MAFTLKDGARLSLIPLARALSRRGRLRLMLRTARSLPLKALDAALRRRASPPGAGSLLPGPLAATRTGLTPAGDDELQNESDHVTIGVTPLARWAYSRVSWNLGGDPV
jgi:hypothetical protein